METRFATTYHWPDKVMVFAEPIPEDRDQVYSDKSEQHIKVGVMKPAQRICLFLSYDTVVGPRVKNIIGDE
tara:strand:+ start:436 stop:648 length:213 start_codon:yes stop_codon:yes gene_type:complete